MLLKSLVVALGNVRRNVVEDRVPNVLEPNHAGSGVGVMLGFQVRPERPVCDGVGFRRCKLTEANPTPPSWECRKLNGFDFATGFHASILAHAASLAFRSSSKPVSA